MRDIGTINDRCEFLESMGFTIGHNDTEVLLDGYTFDFSKTDMNYCSILLTVIQEVEEESFYKGENHLRNNINTLLKGKQ